MAGTNNLKLVQCIRPKGPPTPHQFNNLDTHFSRIILHLLTPAETTKYFTQILFKNYKFHYFVEPKINLILAFLNLFFYFHKIKAPILY